MRNSIKAAAVLSGAGALVVALVAATFSFAQIVTTNDARVLKADDDRRHRMIARACPTKATLMQDAQTREYACVLRNSDGSTLVQAVPDAPYLDAWEPLPHVAGTRIAKR